MRFLVAFLLLLTLLHSATISGSVYSSETFEKMNGTMLRFNGALSYAVLARGGDYYVELEPGEYNVSAVHMEGMRADYFAYEKISVGAENQTFDIVMFPSEYFDSGELPPLDVEVPAKKPDLNYALAAFVALLLAASIFLLARKYKLAFFSKTAQGRAEAEKDFGNEEKAVLRILRENEGRMEQKELRGILKYSETKMSLLLTELEVSGWIKRFKKGRENIVKLKREVQR